MSFDLYLQAFYKGDSATIPRSRVRESFGEAFVTESGTNRWKVQYDARNSCDVHLGGDVDASLLRRLSINRPCGDLRLWDALASILTLGNVVLYFPGCRAPLVANLSVMEHLPLDMIEALGNPIVVGSGGEILREIQAA